LSSRARPASPLRKSQRDMQRSHGVALCERPTVLTAAPPSRVSTAALARDPGQVVTPDRRLRDRRHARRSASAAFLIRAR